MKTLLRGHAWILILFLFSSMSYAAQFDPETATRQYLDSFPADMRARSDAYFTGGYWLQLFDLIYGLGIAWLLLATRWSALTRDRIALKLSNRFVRTMLYVALYVIVTAVLSLPQTFYEGYYREHAYGFANQNFVGWFGDQAKGLGINVIFSSLGFALLYMLIRRLKNQWVIAGTALSISLLIFGIFIAPMYIEPLFNEYVPMKEGAVKTEILRIAHANSIPTSDVLMFNASKQTKRVSANVAGIGSSVRIALNDNLLNRASPEGVAAVMGHEMGHYVLNHVVKFLVFLAVLLAFGFYFIDSAYRLVQRHWGSKFGIGEIGDEAGLPIVIALLSLYMFMATPIFNTIIRTQEMEADFFGLNASQQPDGFAEAMLMTAEYRKAEPGYWEEIVFYDHPSPHTRIFNAMTWKAANLDKPVTSTVLNAMRVVQPVVPVSSTTRSVTPPVR